MRSDKVIAIALPMDIVIAVRAFFAPRRRRRSIPEGAYAVAGFNAEKYLGLWYEIARLDSKWERGLSKVTALYSMNDDGTIRVDSKGFDALRNEWRGAVGRAEFVSTPDIGMLKVSFFGPFYSGYNVVAIDGKYRYALIFGRSHDSMWLLSREKTMPELFIRAYLHRAVESGYDISRLRWTEQR